MCSDVLFTSHRLAAPDRPTPPFPAAYAATAAQAIARALPQDAAFGRGSAANGGDILFLEARAAFGIPCHIVLPFPQEVSLRSSVATDALGDWEARFSVFGSSTPADHRHILTVAECDNPYAASNYALLALTAELGEPEAIAQWDGQTGEGPSGTADLVAKARAKGWPVTVISP